jgi:hypothetical protein
MAVDVSVDAQTKITTLALVGEINGTDLELVRDAIAKHSRRGRLFLIDTGEAKLRVTAEEIRRLAFADTEFPWPIAVYAPNLAAFGLARMFELLSAHRRDVAVFCVREKAIEWLTMKARSAQR